MMRKFNFERQAKEEREEEEEEESRQFSFKIGLIYLFHIAVALKAAF